MTNEERFQLIHDAYSVRIRKSFDGRWTVSLMNLGLHAKFESFGKALLMKERFDALQIKKGSSAKNCRKIARDNFKLISEEV